MLKLEKDFEAFEIQRLLNGQYDKSDCFLSIQCGAGGTESNDWTAMLYRMYKRYAEKKGFRVSVIDEAVADHGFKSVEIKIEGPFAYGYLAGEKGTHRLVRMSPFNALGKRQTTFAGVETWPALEDNDVNVIEIPDRVSSLFPFHCTFLIFSSNLGFRGIFCEIRRSWWAKCE